jgi:hypothetical protein
MITSTFTTTHIRVQTEKIFGEVTKDFEQQLGKFDPTVFQALRADAERADDARARIEAMAGSSGFMLFGTMDHGALLSICQSRLGREPFSRANVSQLSSRGIRIDCRNGDACVVTKVEGSLVQGQAPESYPQIELVSLGSAFEAAKEPSRQIHREAARIGNLRGVQWACAAKLLSTA